MHQWSVSTYKSLCSTEPDTDTMQAQMPKWCLKHDYLMNGLLAIAALEISLVDARHDPFKAEIYLQHALEYYDRGSAEFRAQLDTLNEDNCTELYMFSALAWIISMAIPYDVTYHNEQGILPRTIFLLDLIVGSALIAKESVLWIMKGALASSMQIVIASFMEMGAENWIDEDAENAFEQMKFLNENGPESEVFSRNDYRIAALQLRQCFREEMRGRVKGSALAFPPLGGAPFAASVRNSEPMGLLMLAFWGVMLEKLDRVDKAWWARDVGRSLVEEISSRLLDDRSVIGTMTEFWDCVDWTRRRVGLPAFGSSMEL